MDGQGHRTPDLIFPAFLAHTDDAPLVVGFAGFLERGEVYFHFAKGDAWLLVPQRHGTAGR